MLKVLKKLYAVFVIKCCLHHMARLEENSNRREDAVDVQHHAIDSGEYGGHARCFMGLYIKKIS